MSYTKESIQAAADKIIAAAENGELQPFGQCQYEDANGKCCAIGYLLTLEQRNTLKNAFDEHETAVNGLEISDDRVLSLLGGQEAIETQLGMPMQAARKIQTSFDGRILGTTDEEALLSRFIDDVQSITAEYAQI